MPFPFTELQLSTLRQANQLRVGLFTNAQGDLAHDEKDGSDWTLNDWLVALGGEVGEAMNVAKKFRRGDFDRQEFRQHMAQEIGDILIYLDFVAHFAGLNLAECVIHSFNDKSSDKGLPIVIHSSGQEVIILEGLSE